MAGITLYYIPGLNREDTISFSSKTAQDNFFASQTKVAITEGFYPPHFKDRISLELELVSTSQGITSVLQWNYLRIDFQDKYFYYFIDRVEYVNEDIVDYYISMDTIQTYMFDLNFIHSHVTRKSIKRWVQKTTAGVTVWNINRSYLRENFSSGKFLLKDKKYYQKNSDFYSYSYSVSAQYADNLTGMVFTRRPAAGAAINEKISKLTGEPSLFCTSSCDISFVPEINGSLSHWLNLYKQPGASGNTSNTRAFEALQINIERNPTTIYAYYLPFDTLYYGDKITYISGDNKWQMNVDVSTGEGYESVPFIEENTAAGYKAGKTIEGHVLYDDYALGFVRPTTTCPSFDIKYCPVLLDESYIKITWGESNAKSQFPLHMLLSTVLSFNYIGDIFTGKRIYYITCERGLATVSGKTTTPFAQIPYDVYNTMAVANNLITFDVTSDSFTSYYTYNSASMVAGVATAILSLVSLVA